MKYPRSSFRSLCFWLFFLALWRPGIGLLMAPPARADIVGRLHFTVKNAADEKPIAGAGLVLHDSANVHPDVHLTTDASGAAASPPLEIRSWQISTRADTFLPDTRSLTVAADTTTEVEILLEPRKEEVISIKSNLIQVHAAQTSDETNRDQQFLKAIPATAGNPQSLQKVLLTNPGFVQDSVNQAHPRGEHASTSIYINGFLLPGALQGRAGQILVPDAIQNAEILTGGYAPEYGSETAAILNLDLRSGTITPFQSYEVEGGQFTTFDGSVTFGGQIGQPYGPPNDQGRQAHRLGYLFSLNSRTTDNALEPPQPDDQTAHNSQLSSDFFGNFDYAAGPRDSLSLTLNEAPASTDIANRTGLSSQYAAVGEGFGYGGARNADGTLPGGDPALLGGGTIQLPSQQADGQDIYQNDDNRFALLNYRHSFSDQLTSIFSLGLTRTNLEIHNHNPAIDLGALPVDNSIEFNPDLVRTANDQELSGSLALARPKHTYKAGFLYVNQVGDESYQFIPGSQLALDAMAASSPILAPAGIFQVQNDANGNPQPVNDALGNQVYKANAGASAPVLQVHRTGFYGAAYVQDTWRVSRKFTANYGLRLDTYHQSQNLGQPSVDKTSLSPRINLAYEFLPLTVGRISYNHLFTQPPLAQGAILGSPILPETLDQYEGSVERQVAPRQVVKLAYYYKEITNQIDTGLLFPFTQIGAYSSVNFQDGAVHGIELSYDLTPRHNVGLGGYLSYAYSIAQPNGLDNTGAPAPTYNDHDQRHTLSAGLSYSVRSGYSGGFNVDYGSGVASSEIVSAFFGNSLFNGDRQAHTIVNAQVETPVLSHVASLHLNIENLFDDQSVINFNSGFSGTRFVQGRRILLSAVRKF